MREYRVTWNDMKFDKGVWETTNLEQATSCFMDYLKEGYNVSFQTIEKRAYLSAPTIAKTEKAVTKTPGSGKRGRPVGSKNKRGATKYG